LVIGAMFEAASRTLSWIRPRIAAESPKFRSCAAGCFGSSGGRQRRLAADGDEGVECRIQTFDTRKTGLR